MRLIFTCALLLLVGAPAARGAEAPSAAAKRAAELDAWFEQSVRPVLATRCFTCHANDAKGGLRLDSRAGILKGGKHGPAMTVGHPETSLLVKAIKGDHESLMMPPNGTLIGKDEIAAIERWIRDGAVWPLSDTELFHRQVFPVLRRACLGCHGEEDPENELRVDSRPALIKGGKTGPAIVPGAPDDSLLIQAVRWTHPTFEMPSKKLPKHEIALLETWVRRGAPWPAPEATAEKRDPLAAQWIRWRPTWWSGPPRASTPAAPRKLAARVRNDVDRFVFTQLEALAMEPVAAADRRAWLRRATFTLTGRLAPPAEVDAFKKEAGDETAARARAVERLLASPAYGENWARVWLAGFAPPVPDAVSADSARDRAVYLKFIADAWNRDRGLDAVVRAHLIAGPPAGDGAARLLLSLADRMAEREQPELAARVAVVGRGLFALQVECARCHDHPTDPLRQTDHQALAGLLMDVPAALVPGATGSVQLPFLDLFGPVPVGEKAPPPLAGRLSGPDNLLLARVFVNRVWGEHFGRGLTSTAGNFGSGGEPPSHRALLDHLAAGLMEHGWSLKWLHRQLVLSATYGLAAAGNPAQAARDPDNVYFWRGNPRVVDEGAVHAGRAAVLAQAAAPAVRINVSPEELWRRILADARQVPPPADPVPLAIQGVYRRVLAREANPREIEKAATFLRGHPDRGPALIGALLQSREFRFVM